ncbi:MAG: CopD family protein [Ignavibacteriales bacterium]|nr:CopD family protein [Ignavibacteriales bacterium]
MNAVLNPVLRHQGDMPSSKALSLYRRFFPFLWSSLWTMLVTGTFMALLSPRFLGFDLSTTWGQLLAAKTGLFVLLLIVSWQAVAVVRRIEAFMESDARQAEAWNRTFETLVRRSIVLGIASFLCAAGMAVA